MTSVVVPVDDSLESWVAMDWCVRNLAPSDRVVAVHAACRCLRLSLTGVPSGDPLIGVDDDALRRLMMPLEEAGLSGELIIVPDLPLGALQQVAESHHADLVVIAKTVRGTLHDLISGDVASQLVHRLPCPVLVLPACRKISRPPAKRRGRRNTHMHEPGAG